MTAEQSIRNIERTMDAVNAAARNTPKPDPRADLVDLFEARAETHDDKSWIEVEEAVDLVMDREAETAVEWGLRGASGRVASWSERTARSLHAGAVCGGHESALMQRTVGPWIEVQS